MLFFFPRSAKELHKEATLGIKYPECKGRLGRVAGEKWWKNYTRVKRPLKKEKRRVLKTTPEQALKDGRMKVEWFAIIQIREAVAGGREVYATKAGGMCVLIPTVLFFFSKLSHAHFFCT